jgi:hypothetical protein
MHELPLHQGHHKIALDQMESKEEDDDLEGHESVVGSGDQGLLRTAPLQSGGATTANCPAFD